MTYCDELMTLGYSYLAHKLSCQCEIISMEKNKIYPTNKFVVIAWYGVYVNVTKR